MHNFESQQGGKSIYGASVGILMLDANFPRIPGDIGNATTWDFPVQYRVVKRASPEKIVLGNPMEMLEPFIAKGLDLVESGCDGITTNCGFLSLLQDELQQALDVPVASSSLMQVPWINQLLPVGQHTGVLTISAKTLTEAHLNAANVPAGTPIVGTEQGLEFSQKILSNAYSIDFAQCERDLLQATDMLLDSSPGLGAIVLECTNMVPFAASIRRRSRLPVFSIYNLITWFQQGLMPRRFPTQLDDGGLR